MESKLLQEIQRYDSVRNVGYQHISCFNRDEVIVGSMVRSSMTIQQNEINGPYGISNESYMAERSGELKKSLLKTLSEIETGHMITECTSALYVTNIAGAYEVLKGLRRGLGTKAARRIVDKVYYQGAFDDILMVTKYMTGRK